MRLEELKTLLVTQKVKNLPAIWETQVHCLGWEDSLEKEMATHSRILPWEISGTEEPSRLQSTGVTKIKHNLATTQQNNKSIT